MADQVVASDAGAKFLPHPEGQFSVMCVDVVNLGERVETFPGKPPRIVSKCALIFASGETNPDTGDRHTVSAEFTVSMNVKAGLRLLLEAWRGKSYTDEQARAGVPIHKLVGHPALLSVEHKVSGGGAPTPRSGPFRPCPRAWRPPTRRGTRGPSSGRSARPSMRRRWRGSGPKPLPRITTTTSATMTGATMTCPSDLAEVARLTALLQADVFTPAERVAFGREAQWADARRRTALLAWAEREYDRRLIYERELARAEWDEVARLDREEVEEARDDLPY